MTPTSTSRVTPPANASAEIVTELCHRADMHGRSTYAPAEVIELLRANGYAVDAAVLRDFEARGYIVLPGDGRWGAVAIHQLMAALEARRRWLPSPNPLHDVKKSKAQLEAELHPDLIDREAGKFSCEDLLLMLAGSDNREIREALLVVTQARLQMFGFNDSPRA